MAKRTSKRSCKKEKIKYKYDIKNERGTFKVELSYSSNSLFISCYSEAFPQIIFKKSFTLEELQKINNFFKIYEGIKESKEDITSIFDEKKIKIECKSNEIDIILTLPIKRNNQLRFTLPLIEISKEELDLILLSVLQNLKKKVGNLTNELKFIKRNPSIQKELKMMTNSLIGDIIKEKKDEEWLIEEVKKVLDYEEEYKPTILFLYKATINGDDYNNFHSYCDDYNNTLIIIETDKGKIFGGFTSQMWNCKSNNKNLNKGKNIQDKYFLFNLNKKIILDSQNQNGVYFDTSYPFIFGNINCYELYVENGFLSKGGNSKPGELYGDTNYSISEGESFKIKEVEVYQFN